MPEHHHPPGDFHDSSSESVRLSKPFLSVPSPSGSVADDEDSTYLPEQSSSFVAMKLPAFTGEDTRPTSNKELWGWYAYGWAAEPFVVTGVASFIPITLEQLARDSPGSFLLSDKSKSCHAALVDGDEVQQCGVHFLGIQVNTASFAMYTFSLSVLVQALLIISMSGVADHGRYRKTLLVGFAFVGALATMMYLPVGPQVFVLGALLAIISNTCFGASFVLLNSFLPLLVRRSASVEAVANDFVPAAGEDEARAGAGDMYDDLEDDNPLVSSTAALLPNSSGLASGSSFAASDTVAEQASLQLSTRISANGIGIGYIAAFMVQVIAMLTLKSMGGSLLSLRTALFVVGAWWFVFTIPAAIWLRPRPGPPLELANDGKQHMWLQYLTHSWKSLGKTVLRARHLKDLVLFLAAWFLLSDAIATISGTSVLFAKTSLQMTPVALAMINVTAMVSGMLGAFFWRAAAKTMGLTPLGTILACLAIFALIPLYALIGFIPGSPIGLRHPWEMYPLGFVYGLVLGGLSSYCRSLFGSLIPPGSEAAFYALYAVTDKGSSVVGPAVVGAITDRFGHIRPAFIFLAFLVIAPSLILVWVDVERGTKAAKAAAEDVGGGRLALARDD